MAPNESPGASGPLTVRYAVVPGGPHAHGGNRAELTIPASELSWRFSRSAGPGGQSVNTTDSRAELSYDLGSSTAIPEGLHERALGRLASRLVDGVLTIAASEQRSQLQNREAARERLAALLGEALAPPPKQRRVKKVSKRAIQRRLDGKARRGETKKLRGRIDGY
jgi:ribosome-associated protein